MINKEYNFGIALLRIWMCFEVVLCHFRIWTVENDFFYIFHNLAVPVFMISAFVFCDIEKMSNKEKMKKRIYRLVVPHFVWTCVYYLIYRILDMKKGTNLLHGKTDFMWQFLLGHSYNATLWFQVVLIISTILFCIIFKRFKKEVAVLVSLILGYIALYLQYANVLFDFFRKIKWPETVMGGYFSEFYVIYSVGRLPEMIPYVVLGIVLCNLKAINIIKDIRYKIYIVMGSFLLLNLFLKFDFFLEPEKGFGYQGIKLIVISCLTLTFFYYLPLDKIPQIMKKVILEVSKYTMGIYFIHRLVGVVLYNTPISTWLKMNQGTMYDCCIIFVVSYTIARLIYLIPVKWVKMSVS